MRTVRIEGIIEKLPLTESDKYFKACDFDIQLVALCSEQSKPISGMHILDDKITLMSQRIRDQKISRPKSFGGYIVVPNYIEFFQGQADRLHDRIRFRKARAKEWVDDHYTYLGEDDWVYERLQP